MLPASEDGVHRIRRGRESAPLKETLEWGQIPDPGRRIDSALHGYGARALVAAMTQLESAGLAAGGAIGALLRPRWSARKLPTRRSYSVVAKA